MTAAIDQTLAWSKKQVIQRTGAPRPYRGPYPDLTGPSCAEMDKVARIADAIEGNPS
ncbi:hypothetical protein [Sphingorhabdus sp. 109]|uniref:hypothetical protein n=1 Tax=Sphingorhabdus sp. 109 TaxID=2653173 RepID=UPI0012F36A4E|nr:hypothetical protein [Sphingorhabdus sp. 109]VWX56685.1 hypothetical protein SPHINGOR109_10539 [Sphingorhabdus sp. 109]